MTELGDGLESEGGGGARDAQDFLAERCDVAGLGELLDVVGAGTQVADKVIGERGEGGVEGGLLVHT